MHSSVYFQLRLYVYEFYIIIIIISFIIYLFLLGTLKLLVSHKYLLLKKKHRNSVALLEGHPLPRQRVNFYRRYRQRSEKRTRKSCLEWYIIGTIDFLSQSLTVQPRVARADIGSKVARDDWYRRRLVLQHDGQGRARALVQT